MIMKRAAIILCAGMVLLAGCANRNDIYRLNNRMAQLEQRLQDVDRSSSSQVDTDRALREKVAELRVLIEDLRKEFDALNGRVEEVDHLSKQRMQNTDSRLARMGGQLKELEQIVADNTARLTPRERQIPAGGVAGPPSGTEPAGGEPSRPTAAGEQLSPETALYEKAKEAFERADFDAARQGFRELLDQHPRSENADNAQFWIGESYYSEKWYEKAILEYQKVIENYPKGNKVPAALLKQGFAFFNIGDQANARLILKELIRKYPDSNEARTAGEKLEGF
jgi:tol-pal system protein YbgF